MTPSRVSSSNSSSSLVCIKTMAENTTAIAVGEEHSTVFRGLSKASEVAVWASILVGVLGVLAVVLRLIMPFVRRKCAKDGRRGKGKGLDKSSLNGSSG